MDGSAMARMTGEEGEDKVKAPGIAIALKPWRD